MPNVTKSTRSNPQGPRFRVRYPNQRAVSLKPGKCEPSKIKGLERPPFAFEGATEQAATLRDQYGDPHTRCKCERGPPFDFSLLLGLVPGTTFCLVITIKEGTRNVCGKPKPNGAAAASRRNLDAKPKKSSRQFSYSRWRALRGR